MVPNRILERVKLAAKKRDMRSDLFMIEAIDCWAVDTLKLDLDEKQ